MQHSILIFDCLLILAGLLTVAVICRIVIDTITFLSTKRHDDGMVCATVIKKDDLMAALTNTRQGTLREAFPGEEPDFVQGFHKECTGVTMIKDGVGFSCTFDFPIILEAGVGYVFEEHV